MTIQRPVTIFLRDRPIVEWQRVMAARWILRGVKLRIESGSYNSVLSWLRAWGDWKVEMLDDIIGISVAGQCNIFATNSMLPNVFISKLVRKVLQKRCHKLLIILDYLKKWCTSVLFSTANGQNDQFTFHRNFTDSIDPPFIVYSFSTNYQRF